MLPRNALLVCCIAIISLATPGRSTASDFWAGCQTRPACGKICKLVCEKKTIVATCYACECAEICIPTPSRPGCKYCQSCCDPEGCIAGCGSHACGPGCHGCKVCQDEKSECKFCWREWFACGCASPRTVKVLAKYKAEKEICWYHWEVVDTCAEAEAEVDLPEVATGEVGLLQHPLVYKAAPADAQPGEVLPVLEEERATLAAYLPADERSKAIQFPGGDEVAQESGGPATVGSQSQATPASAEADLRSAKQRLIEFFNR